MELGCMDVGQYGDDGLGEHITDGIGGGGVWNMEENPPKYACPQRMNEGMEGEGEGMDA